jgi:hypothetical protein
MNFSAFLLEFKLFSFTPTFDHSNNKFFKEKFIYFLYSLVLVYFMSLFTFMVGRIFFYVIDYHFAKELFTNQKGTIFTGSILKNIFYILLIAPIIEEIIFRLPLNLRKLNLYIGFSLYYFLRIGVEFYDGNLHNYYFHVKILVLVGLWFFIYKIKLSFLKAHYCLYFYLLVALFAAIHVVNFIDFLPEKYYVFIPLLVMPQFIMGVFAGFVRIKLGFIWSIPLHIGINSPSIFIYLLTLKN